MAKTRSKALKQTTLLDAFSSSPSHSPPPQYKPPKGTRPKGTKRRPAAPKGKRKRGSIIDIFGKAAGSDLSDSGVGAIHFEKKVIELTDDSEDSESIQRRSKKRKTRVLDSDDEDVKIDSDDHLQEEETNLPRRKTRFNKGKQRQITTSDDEEPEEIQPRRRKLLRGVKSPSPGLEDDEVDTKKILATRLRSRGKKTAYQQGLEKLKRRKQGKLSESEPEDEDENEDNEDNDEDDDHDDDEDGEIIKPFKGAKPSADRGSDASDSEEEAEELDDNDDFIVEDDGAQPMAQLPAEFSMETHQDLVHHFKIIFQFFVHVAVQTPNRRKAFMKRQMKNEEYFSVPLQIARRKISGLRDSLVASSVWRPDFRRALEKYPEFELVTMDFALPNCDACHLGGRLSTLTGRLSGTPYDKSGFEPLPASSDTDEDDDTLKKEFSLGRFCAKRTRVFHEFSHWEYSLFKSLCDELDSLRGKGFIRVAHGGGIRPPKDLTDADGICEWLDQRKVIEIEWQKVNGMMESARTLEMAARRGGDDGE